MVSIRTTSPEQMVSYVYPGDTLATNQIKPPNWDQSLFQLAQGLQTICRSPDASDRGKHLQNRPTKQANRSIEDEVTQCANKPKETSNMGRHSVPPQRSLSDSQAQPYYSFSSDTCIQTASNEFRVSTQSDVFTSQRMPVRHQQSESKLEEKLKEICHSPREKVIPHDHQGVTACGMRICPAHRRPSFLHQPLLLASADVGACKGEDLSIRLEDGILQVSLKDKEDTEKLTLITSVMIPPDVDTQHLVCILRENKLEVSQTGKRKQTQERHSYSVPSSEGLGYIPNIPDNSNPAPIVIEDKVDTDCVRLVLTVPLGYKMEQISIRTVDDHLIIKGRPRRKKRKPQRSMSVEDDNGQIQTKTSKDALGFTRIFELPSSWDPFSIVAHMNDQHQLLIDARLSYRCRCHTL